jgi:ATP-dependent RNA helicase RhlE
MTAEPHPATFESLGLVPELLRAVSDLDFVRPTAIQAQSIPAALTGRDVVGCAHTGSGKTAAFSLPALQRIATEGLEPASSRPVVLVLSPTRELAMQIDEVFEELGRFLDLRTACLVGGMNMGVQTKALHAAPHVVVATPGRLLDHMRRRNIWLDRVKMLVLDEADRMLDMGFQEQIDAILAKVPKDRQTMLFSATMDHGTNELARTSVKNPVQADVSDELQDIPQVELNWIELLESDKRRKLEELLAGETESTLVFVNTKVNADILAKRLRNDGFKAKALHGGRDQSERLKALESFRDGKTQVLVATDVAARGIDVEDIKHVINFDMPFSPADFVHRIGRTARAGATGKSTAFVTVGDRETAKRILRLLEDRKPAEEKDDKVSFGRPMKKATRRGVPTQGRKLF